MHFKDVTYDESGRYLLMHHKGAYWYYKVNVAAVMLFFGVSLYAYMEKPDIYFNQDWVANTYLNTIQLGMLGAWLFSNRHIRSIHLLKGGKQVAITTYSNFGFTLNKARIIDISTLQGNRAVGSAKLNLYQLEYEAKGYFTGLTKHRSFFYRP